ncbi:Eco57I restriction-modification methylase domain-containing protein, partial [Nocardioides humi]
APEVMIDRGGFDAVIGNPPFLAPGRISDAMGVELRTFLVNDVADGQAGSVDVCVYFMRRAAGLVRRSGMVSLILTNSVAQGDAREVGFDELLKQGWDVFRAVRSMQWPTRSADVSCALVWLSAQEPKRDVLRVSDGIAVRKIGSTLEPALRTNGKPLRLAENRAIAFKGHNVYGQGFIISEDEADALVDADQNSVEVIFPFPDGRNDLNTSPTQRATKRTINFRRWSLAQAQRYPGPYRWVEERVKPERASNARASRRERWWQYGDYAGGLEEAIADLERVAVYVVVSKVVMASFVDARQVFNHNLCVIASDDRATWAVLSSSVHQNWAIANGGSVEARVAYNPSDVFETFPRPQLTDELKLIGLTLDEERRELMVRRELGLTAVYNLMNDGGIQGDKDVDRLREIHVEIDRATMIAYGWDDVALDHGFHTYRGMERWTVSPAARVEILDRLLELNHERARAEGQNVPNSGSAGQDTLFT